MFGLISKKKIAKIALEIYLRNDADKSSFEPGEQRVQDSISVAAMRTR